MQRSLLETDELEDLNAKVIALHDLLCKEYGCPIAYFHNLDPLSELVSALLSHRTKNKDSGQAFRQLRAAFSAWEDVRDAKTEDVQKRSHLALGRSKKRRAFKPSLSRLLKRKENSR